MRVSKLITYTAIGILVTPVAILLAVLSGGAGHGHYEFARLLFPFSMLSTLAAGNSIGPILIGLALIQFPIYGLSVGFAAQRARTWDAVAFLAILHLVAVAVCFSGVIPNFS